MLVAKKIKPQIIIIILRKCIKWCNRPYPIKRPADWCFYSHFFILSALHSRVDSSNQILGRPDGQKINVLPWGANQWPLIRETLFSYTPPCNYLLWISDPWRVFWADTVPLNLEVVHCFGTTEHTGLCQVWLALRQGPQDTDANLNSTFVESGFTLFLPGSMWGWLSG